MHHMLSLLKFCAPCSVVRMMARATPSQPSSCCGLLTELNPVPVLHLQAGSPPRPCLRAHAKDNSLDRPSRGAGGDVVVVAPHPLIGAAPGIDARRPLWRCKQLESGQHMWHATRVAKKRPLWTTAYSGPSIRPIRRASLTACTREWQPRTSIADWM
jgi:hypothetical protein